ncbi:MAG TPA: TIM barrel protein [Armatimonadota bacterium]|jgi:sugar phosphate isomerase/epimerase
MRLGGPVFDTATPEGWVAAHGAAGYRAAYWPGVAEDEEAAYVAAAQAADLVIAEVGAWSNPLSPDDEKRREAVAHCQAQLATAERVGARCCVNIVGSRGEKWDGPCAEDLTEETFALIVDTVREILDAVQPTRTYYTLETMPWMYPDSVASYQRLLAAIARPAFAVHFDPVNLVNCPARYFRNGALIEEFVAALGSRIRSSHAKDILLGQELTVHLSEVRPGEGGLDYPAFLRALASLDPDTPVMLEHLPAEQYPAAARHLRAVADQEGLTL